MDIRFGNLTTQTGQQIKFEDMGKDSDGTITEQEYNAALQEYGLDSVELSTVDTNGDKEVSNEEFQLWEQKIKMEEALAPYIQKVTTDFIGANSAYAGDMTTALRELIDKFSEEYTSEGKNVSEMASAFEAILPTRYEEIKEEILYNTPEAQAEREAQEKADAKSNVIDELLAEAKQEATTRVSGNEALMDDAAASTYIKNLGPILEKEADTFIAAYTGDNLEADLRAHLEAFLATSDREKISDEIADWESKTSGSKWDYIDSNELETLKGYAKELLNAAVEQGLTVTIDGYSYTNAASLERKIDAYTDGEALKTAVDKFLDSLSTETVKETTRTKSITEAEAAEQAAFTAVKGEEYAVDAATIDFSSIDGYYDDEKITVKGKSGHDDRIQDEVRSRIEESNLKDQMREQIKTMLESKGISFDMVETVFENVWNTTLNDTIDNITSYKSKHRVLNKKKEYTSNEGIQTIVQNFISSFNTNIATAINEMNASSTDMDIIDLDYSAAGEDENGNPIIQDGYDISTLYATGEVITTKKKGADYYVSLAERMIDNMKSQMLNKAQTLCEANGVEFDEQIFNTMFTNAKYTAISAGVTGVDAKGATVGIVGVASGTAAGIVGGVGQAAISVAAAKAGGLAGSFGGPIGIAIGAGIGAVVGGLLSLFGKGNKSSSTLDARTLLDTFTSEFKTNYTDWVEKQKEEVTSE